MQVPIPQDWNGQDWLCIEVQWPDSPQFVGLLFGFLTQMTRGRFWDAATGSILDAQSIAWEVHDRNFPLHYCADGPGTQPDTEYINRMIAGIESEELMSLCGYNPKAFKIENGALWVKDFCGEWVKIGALSSQPDLPPGDDIIPDPPPGGYENSTACAKARKLANVVFDLITVAFDNLEGISINPIDMWNYYVDMQDAVPGIDLAYSNIINLWGYISVLEVGGFEAETLNPLVVQALACAWVDLLDDTNEGITSAQYDALILATEPALAPLFPTNSLSGFGKSARFAYVQAVAAIGPKDAEKITYYAQPVAGEDCLCPDFDGGSESDVSSSGWYLSAPVNNMSILVPQDAGGAFPYDTYGFPASAYDAPHDVFGVQWVLTVAGGGPTNYKRSNDGSASGLTHDVFMFPSNSDSIDPGYGYGFIQCAASVFTELASEGIIPAGRGQFNNGVIGSDPQSPPVTAGQIALAQLSVPGSGVVSVEWRWLHNTNSPSHQ